MHLVGCRLPITIWQTYSVVVARVDRVSGDLVGDVENGSTIESKKEKHGAANPKARCKAKRRRQRRPLFRPRCGVRHVWITGGAAGPRPGTDRSRSDVVPSSQSWSGPRSVPTPRRAGHYCRHDAPRSVHSLALQIRSHRTTRRARALGDFDSAFSSETDSKS